MLAFIAPSPGRQVRAPGTGSSGDQEESVGQDTLATQLPDDRALPIPVSSCWLPGQRGPEGASAGQLAGAGRELDGEALSHCSPPPPLLHLSSGSLRCWEIPQALLSPGYWPILSPPTSCLHRPRPSLTPVPVTWDCEEPSWLLQGAAGEAGDAAVATGHSQGAGD